MIRIAIVDDDASCAAQIESYCLRYASEKGCDLAPKKFPSGFDFISDYAPVYDIVLLDIEMPMMDGLETAVKLRRLGDKAPVIFITNMANYAVRGYEVSALDFMVKPVTYFNFAAKLTRAVSAVEARRNDFVALMPKDGAIKLYTDDIKYVEVHGHNIVYHTFGGETQVRGSMREAQELLAPRHFARCNNCWLVNLKHVSEVKNEIVRVADEELSISRNRRKEFMNALTVYFAGGGS